METKNHYETHITLATVDDSVLKRVQDWAETHNLKWTHIVLDGGESPSQPMVTFWGTGTSKDQLERSARFVNELEQLGAEVVRVKTEAAIENDDVPAAEAENDSSPQRYFEHHIKLLLAEGADLDQLRTLVEPHAARLSRNARRVRQDDHEERFVTQRLFGTIKQVAQQRLRDLLALLQRNEYEILEIEEEYVVFDSNLDLDKGWLPTENEE